MFFHKRNPKNGIRAGKLFAAVLALLLLPSLTQALTYNFNSVLSGPLAGTMTGSFTIDDLFVDGAGNTANVGTASGLNQLNLTFNNTTYLETSDLGYGGTAPFDFPLVRLSNWDVAYMDFMVVDQQQQIFFTLFDKTFTYGELTSDPKGPVAYSSLVKYEKDVPVPEPATMVLFGIGLVSMGTYYRKKI